MADTLRNPNDRKYLGHNIHKPKKWINLSTKKAKKSPIKKTMGPVKLNPKYTEWKEKQKEKISKIKFNKYLKKKQVINN
jgi:hypothetical protein